MQKTTTNLDEATEQIKEDIKNNPVLLYMKGNKLAPQCGFSAHVVSILDQLNVSYETRDILLDEYLRQAIKDYSDWPTLPQLYVNNTFIGGCDVVTELFENGELKTLIKA